MSKKRKKKKKAKFKPDQKESVMKNETAPHVATNFKLNIPDHVMTKIRYWINKADFEVSGFGSLDYDEKTNEFTVRDAILLKQKVGPTSAEIEPEALNRAIYQMRDEPNALKWHWHSHVNMNVFWSKDDMEIIRSLGQRGWILASVFNRKEEVRTAFLTTTQIFGRPHDVFVDEIPTFYLDNLSDELRLKLDKEYDEMVEPLRPSRSDNYYLPLTANLRASTSEYQRLSTSEHQRLLIPDEEKAFIYDESGTLIYNPVHDPDIKTESGLMAAIDSMDWNEISRLRNRCPKFARALEYYLEEKAQTPRAKHESIYADDYKPQWIGE